MTLDCNISTLDSLSGRGTHETRVRGRVSTGGRATEKLLRSVGCAFRGCRARHETTFTTRVSTVAGSEVGTRERRTSIGTTIGRRLTNNNEATGLVGHGIHTSRSHITSRSRTGCRAGVGRVSLGGRTTLVSAHGTVGDVPSIRAPSCLARNVRVFSSFVRACGALRNVGDVEGGTNIRNKRKGALSEGANSVAPMGLSPCVRDRSVRGAKVKAQVMSLSRTSTGCSDVGLFGPRNLFTDGTVGNCFDNSVDDNLSCS